MSDMTDGIQIASAELATLEGVAIDVATSAGRLIVEERPAHLGVASTKSSATDVVTVMDQRAQDHLLGALARRRPGDAVLGEEQGGRAGDSGITWVVDPIDGTVNYLYGLPAYAVSVAAVIGDPSRAGTWKPVAAAVVNPVSGECFHAHRGGGAWRRVGTGLSVPVTVGHPRRLGEALVATGFGYAADTRRWQAEVLTRVLPLVRDIRRLGSAALDLCRVASGEVDAYYESGLNAWDLAGGWLVASEAGAVVGGLQGAGAAPSADLTWACAPEVATEFGLLVTAATADLRGA